jgi:hypothetical protein
MLSLYSYNYNWVTVGLQLSWVIHSTIGFERRCPVISRSRPVHEDVDGLWRYKPGDARITASDSNGSVQLAWIVGQ